MSTITDDKQSDPLAAAAEAAWLEYAKGTFMRVDKRIFMAGWHAAMRYAAKKTAEGIEHLDDEHRHGPSKEFY